MKFAIVDLGSNTIRLSVYNTLPEGGFDLLFSEKEMAGLGQLRPRRGALSGGNPAGLRGHPGLFRRCCGSLIWTPPTYLPPPPCGTSLPRGTPLSWWGPMCGRWLLRPP